MWIYGSGFPKSLNIGIAIDKQAGLIGHRAKAFVVAGQGKQKDNLRCFKRSKILKWLCDIFHDYCLE